jgi:hypothetical protein
MISEYNLNLPKDVIIQAWQSQGAVEFATSLGYRVIAGSSEYWVSARYYLSWAK